MGCGQSKIHLYPRKSKSKANGKKGGHADSDAETDEDEGHIEDAEKAQQRDREKHDESEEQSNKDIQDSDEDVAVSLLRAKNLSLLQSHQQNFFRMLDKKIDEGPDYDSASETEIALEEARLNALRQHWESASITASICSSASRSLQTTPIRQVQVPLKQPPRGAGLLLQPSSAASVVSSAMVTLPTTEYLPQHMMAGRQQQQQVQTQQQQQAAAAAAVLYQQQQQQLILLPQLETNVVNTSTAAAAAQLAQLQQQQLNQQQQQQQQLYQQQQQYLLSLPAGAKPQSVSPKRLIYASTSSAPVPPPAPPPSVQYITAGPQLGAGGGFLNGAGAISGIAAGRGPLQLAYYGAAPSSTAPSRRRPLLLYHPILPRIVRTANRSTQPKPAAAAAAAASTGSLLRGYDARRTDRTGGGIQIPTGHQRAAFGAAGAAAVA
ncbi:mediator of RNA polymerase II transcription subunit 15 isoform X2 [Drosophila serrata]|uniref:mediator of RNA polymerase II transcription subunit 15 isoform X2 n=1 Tax=Drosophila serrata TaxID=7274 RepID=UPI000A1D3496|nr:mediator of RNA polymerase II transcription subunit 15 isoform X2 [Drosophila serrata]